MSCETFATIRLHSVALIPRFLFRGAMSGDVKDQEIRQQKSVKYWITFLLAKISVVITFHRTEHHGSPKQGFPGKCTWHRVKSLQFSVQKLLQLQTPGKTPAGIDKAGKSCG
jgi:hypothetical protein